MCARVCVCAYLLSYKRLHFLTVVESSFILHRIIEANSGKCPLTYNSMQAIVKKLGAPKRPIAAPSTDDLKGAKNTRCPHGCKVVIMHFCEETDY